MIFRRKNKGTIVKVDGVDLTVLLLVVFTTKAEFGGMDFTMEIRSFFLFFGLL